MVDLIVKVIDNGTGKPVKGKRISVSCDELLSLWTTEVKATDSGGISQFSVARVGFKGNIKVDGKKVFEGKIMASNTIYS